MESAHLEKQGRRAKVVLWEHNSHLGDARFTEMSEQGELNVGQLVRERYGASSFLIGFSTYTGTVTEDVLQQVSTAPYYLLFRDDGPGAEELSEPRLQRAIGVIYLRRDPGRRAAGARAHVARPGCAETYPSGV